MRGQGRNEIVKRRLLITTIEDMIEDKEVKEGSRVVWLGIQYPNWAAAVGARLCCIPLMDPSHPSMGGISMDGRPFHGDLPYISWMGFLPPIGLLSMDSRFYL